MARTAPGYARPCRKGLHTIPAGALTCPACAATREQERSVGRYAKRHSRPNATHARLRTLHLPLVEILDGAQCGPDSAHLFDVGAPKHAKGEENARHAAARSICAGCPVADACRADAYASHQLGVYGGTVMDQGFWAKEGRRQQALVQSVQVVQDSSAC